MKTYTLCLYFLANAISFAYAQQTGYQLPPKPVKDILEAPTQPKMQLSPDNSHILFEVFGASYVSLAKLNRTTHRLAGIDFSPETNYNASFLMANAIKVKKADGDSTLLTVSGIPSGAQLFDVKWSPDSRKIAFCLDEGNGIFLWYCDMESMKARRLLDVPLNFSMEYDLYKWNMDSQSLLCLVIPGDRVEPEQADYMEASPIVVENEAGAKPSRTYQGLLQNPYDEALFDYYATSQLIKVGLNGEVGVIGAPQIVLDFDPSPDGNYILAAHALKPYSYQYNIYSFPSQTMVFTQDGKLVKDFGKTPLKIKKTLGRDSEVEGPREYAWRSDAPATLYWIEALDEGNADSTVSLRDEMKLLSAPFNGDPISICQMGYRFYDVFWSSDSLAIVAERWWKDRKMQWLRLDPSKGKIIDTISTHSSDGLLDIPGRPYLQNAKFHPKLMAADEGIYLTGYRYEEAHGVVPVLKKYDLKTKSYEEIWKSSPPYYELPLSFLDTAAGKERLLVSRQSRYEPKNYVEYDLVNDKSHRITYNKNLLTGLDEIEKKDLVYFREDSVRLYANLYYPKNHPANGEPLPTLVWAYPVNYKSKESASEILNSPYLYSGNYSLEQLLATQGYVILDFAAFPVVGEGDAEPNDTYLEQIEADAKAAILAAHETGVVDTSRMAIAGHSYGAFMVANLLTHTNLFKTGIAQSGAYNRSLTPFGFQSEYRNYWQSQELYHQISPFQQAHKLQYPLLLVHGKNDDNPGTFTLQSDRYFEALKGLGKTVRYVGLPFEGHIYQSLESKLHLSYEMLVWLNKYLKEQEVQLIAREKDENDQ